MSFRIARSSSTGLLLGSLLSLSACQAHSLSAAMGFNSAAPSASPTATSGSSGSSSGNAASAPDGSRNLLSAGDCPSSSDLPGDHPDTFTGSNNSPFSARTDPEPTVCEIARENNHKWTRLVGYTPDEATKRAKAAGWEGRFEVLPLREYDAKCKEGMVCSLQPARWEIGQGSTLTLYVNHKVTISTPD
jgi:hypothetical protein